MELLVSTAAIFGIDRLRFDVLAENRAMRTVLQRLGATGTPIPEDAAILRYHLPVPEGEVDPTIGALYLLLRTAAEGAGPASDVD